MDPAVLADEDREAAATMRRGPWQSYLRHLRRVLPPGDDRQADWPHADCPANRQAGQRSTAVPALVRAVQARAAVSADRPINRARNSVPLCCTGMMAGCAPASSPAARDRAMATAARDVAGSGKAPTWMAHVPPPALPNGGAGAGATAAATTGGA